MEWLTQADTGYQGKHLLKVKARVHQYSLNTRIAYIATWIDLFTQISHVKKSKFFWCFSHGSNCPTY